MTILLKNSLIVELLLRFDEISAVLNFSHRKSSKIATFSQNSRKSNQNYTVVLIVFWLIQYRNASIYNSKNFDFSIKLKFLQKI